MKFKELLEEYLYIGQKSKELVLIDPTKKELSDYLREVKGRLRGLYSVKKNKIYLWDASRDIHDYMKFLLAIRGKIDKSERMIKFFLERGKKRIEVNFSDDLVELLKPKDYQKMEDLFNKYGIEVGEF